MKYSFLTAIFALALAACATPPPAGGPLQPVANPAAITITTPLSFHEARGPLSLNMEFGLMPGIYVASRENTLGTYYVSEDHPVWQRQVGSKGAMTNQGGIWVPKDTGKLAQIYIIAESASSHEQDLDKAITQRGSTLSNNDNGVIGLR